MTDEQINKAAEEYADSTKNTAGLWNDIRGSFIKGANLSNKHWKEKTRWIPVTERLPENKNISGFSNLVLTKNKYGNIMLERYDYEYGRFNGLRYGEDVTHWREIE